MRRPQRLPAAVHLGREGEGWDYRPPTRAGGRSVPERAREHSQEEAALLEGYLSAVREKQSILEAELLALEVRERRRSRDGQAGGSQR